MSDLAAQRVYWTVADLDLLPDTWDGTRYEIIDRELFVSKSPHWHRQEVCGNLYQELRMWSQASGLGRAGLAPGVLFSNVDAVIPDVVWISNKRLAELLDRAGHLTGAPELAIEVLSSDPENELRDRQAKLKVYSMYGVQEYWIVDWQLQQVTIYRREQGMLRLALTLLAGDELTSPLLPGFACPLARLFT